MVAEEASYRSCWLDASPPSETPKNAARPAAMPMSAQLRRTAPLACSTLDASHEVLAAHSAAAAARRYKSGRCAEIIGGVRTQAHARVVIEADPSPESSESVGMHLRQKRVLKP